MAQPRLPVPGHDDGVWGEILNEFLLVSHNQDGTLKTTGATGSTVDEAYVANAVQPKANTADLSPVAFSGAYNDLTGRPTLVSDTDPRLSNTRTPTDDTVSTAKLQDSSVTEAKLAITNTPTSGDQLSWDGTTLAWVAPAAAPVQSVNGQDGTVVLTKSDVGLGSVNNTADADKPISTATQTALDAKMDSADLATVATSGSYTDLSNRPTFSTVATSGDYADLTGLPTLPGPGTTASTYTVGNDSRVTGALQQSTVTAKGDLLVASGNATIERLGVGSDGQLLVADSSQTGGVRWATPAAQATGIQRVVATVSADTTAAAAAETDYVYIVTGAHTLTLPTATGNTNRYTVKNRHTADITLGFTSSQTADGGGITLSPNASVDMISDGSNWVII